MASCLPPEVGARSPWLEVVIWRWFRCQGSLTHLGTDLVVSPLGWLRDEAGL
jgi:hypothetical protein